MVYRVIVDERGDVKELDDRREPHGLGCRSPVYSVG
jgi:hypothetical protein